MKSIIMMSKSELLALVKHWINSWDPPCELCKIGSKRIKPKVSDENWELLENSQK